MSFLNKDKVFKVSLQVLVILAILYLLGKMDYIFSPIGNILTIILTPIIFGGFLYYMIRPLVSFIERGKIKRTTAVIIVLLLLIVFISVVMAYGGVTLSREITSFVKDIVEQFNESNFSENIKWPFENVIPFAKIQENVLSFIEATVKNVGKSSFATVGLIGSVGSQIVLIPFVLFYLLIDGEKFISIIINSVPLKHRDNVEKVFIDIDKVLSIYISGQLLVALTIGSLTYIGYKIIGLPSAFVLASINMMFSVIPFIGPIVGLIPAVFIALNISFNMIIKVVIVAIVVQQLEGNFVSPKIIGDKLKIHPLVIILLVTTAITQFGIIGAFLVIPLYSVLRVVIKDINKIKKDNVIKSNKDGI